MAFLFVQPFAPGSSLGFPGGVAGGYPVVTDSTARTAAAQFTVGTTALDSAGNRYLYVQFGGTVAATDCVRGGTTTGLSGVIQTANTATGDPFLGCGHAAATNAQFGWIQTHGVMTVKSGNITAGATVLPKTTAGTVNDAAATDIATRAGLALADDAAGVVSLYLP